MTTYTPLSFAQTFRDGTLIMELKGAMDSALCLDGALEAAEQSPARHVIVVITGVDYINSAGFSALIRFSDVVTEGEKTLYVVGLEEKVHVVFHSLGAHNVLNILPTLTDAMARIAEEAK